MNAAANLRLLAEESFVRRAPSSSSTSWDETERTVEVVMSTGAAVARRSYLDGPFTEILEISRSAIDLSRVDGMSVIDSHSSYSIESRVGTIVAGSVRIAGASLIGLVRLSRNALGEALAQDLRDGHPLSVSVGYRIEEFEWTDATDTAPAKLVATRWTPLELSVVCIPADPAARTRSLERTHQMSRTAEVPDELTEVPVGARRAPPALRPNGSGAEDERDRVRSILAIGRRMNLPQSTIDQAVDTGVQLEAFRNAAFDYIVRQQEATSTFPFSDRSGGRSNSDVVDELRDAILGKPGGRDGGAIVREFAASQGLDIRGLGDRQLSRIAFGRNSGSDHWDGRAGRGYHTTSDFTHIVSQAAQGALLELFAKNPSLLKTFSRKRNAADFKEQSFVRPTDAPELLRVNEAGEIKSGTFGEEQQGFRIETYARMVALSLQLSVNDNLNALGEMLESFSTKGAELEANIFALILRGMDGTGALMRDGLPLFDPLHRNIAETPSTITLPSVNEAVLALRTQVDAQGHRVSSTPKTLLVGPEMELAARQFVATISPTKISDVNPFSFLEVAVEDRIVGKGWYVVADSSRPVFIHGYLDGYGEGPIVEAQEGWRTLGIEYRAVLHFGAGIYDHRPIFFNPGTDPV